MNVGKQGRIDVGLTKVRFIFINWLCIFLVFIMCFNYIGSFSTLKIILQGGNKNGR